MPTATNISAVVPFCGRSATFAGKELVDGVMGLVDAYRPVHVSLVGGEPLVRYKEVSEILPQIEARDMYIQVVTSAVRPIPIEWSRIKKMDLVVSIDGLAPEHDVRRKPATYERILQHIKGHHITVHCTITRQMTERPGYLREFLAFWSAQKETQKIWISLFTPQMGETSYEILPQDVRRRVIEELLVSARRISETGDAEGGLTAFLKPPSDPEHCIFARTTTTITANLRHRVTPCQFGGTPDCSQCGCMATAGLEAVGAARLPMVGFALARFMKRQSSLAR